MRKTWLTDVVGTEKAAFGLVHLKALPGDPLYDKKGGLEAIYEAALADVNALQEGGIDAIHFSNEFSFPYLLQPPKETIATMAYIIGRLKPYIKVPFGANVISNPADSIAICAATGAKFTRGTFSGVFSGGRGLIEENAGKLLRYRKQLEADVKLIHYVVPESCAEIGGRQPLDIAKSAKFNNLPDGFAVAGSSAGQPANMSLIHQMRECMPDMVLVASTGVKYETIEETYSVCDAAFIATSLKKDGIFENPVDKDRVKRFMDGLKEFRAKNL